VALLLLYTLAGSGIAPPVLWQAATRCSQELYLARISRRWLITVTNSDQLECSTRTQDCPGAAKLVVDFGHAEKQLTYHGLVRPLLDW